MKVKIIETFDQSKNVQMFNFIIEQENIDKDIKRM